MKLKANIGILARILLGVLLCFPIVLAVLFSFQTNQEAGTVPLHLFTKNPTLENYQYILEAIPVFTYLKNTVVMLIICIPAQLILGSLAAYAFSFFEFPLKNALFTVMLMVMMIPGEVVIVTNYTTIQNLGLVNTYAGMTIVSLVSVSGIFMLRQNMLAMPKELWEAARMDGCGYMQYFYKVVLPLSKSILAAQTINSFIGIYNSYFWPLLVTNIDEMRTIQTGLASLISANRFGWILAAACLSMIIPVVVFIFGQDKIVEGMTAGAVKS